MGAEDAQSEAKHTSFGVNINGQISPDNLFLKRKHCH